MRAPRCLNLAGRSSTVTSLANGLARAWVCVIWAVLLPMTASASSPSAECLHWGSVSAARNGIPQPLMRAIAIAETGKAEGGKTVPWPWTVNVAGKGRWFQSRQATLDFLVKQQASGQTNFDVGCFQLNYRWHGGGFSSLDAMLEPSRNAEYAARFLQQLHQEFGSWEAAAKAYHSRTPEYADRYMARLVQLGFDGTSSVTPAGPLAREPAAQDPVIASVWEPRPLFASGSSRMGSLVPMSASASAGSIWDSRK